MNRRSYGERAPVARLFLSLAAIIVALALAPAATATELPGLTVIGVQRNADGTTTEVDLTADAYRWLVEEDKTYHVGFDGSGNPVSVPPGGTQNAPLDPNWDKNWENTLSVSFHKSYMPLVAKGCVGFLDLATVEQPTGCNEVPLPELDPDKHYFVSVLPRSGYAIGGVGFRFKGGDTAFTAYVNQTPLPTAQISIFVFPDTAPVNGAPDTPTEDPLTGPTDMSGFKIVLEDGGGRYGAASGIQSTDVYGNPLGTSYCTAADIAAAGNGDPCDGALVGDLIQMGNGTILTGADGWAHIYNLAQGKYGIQAVPPAGTGWVQTSTIEGTLIIDAWVKPNEPPFFSEFGPPGPHVFIGFVKEMNEIPVGPNPRTITGTVVGLHMSRPPDYAVYNGACFGHTTPWVALNDLSVGIGVARYVAPTDADCNFSIPNVPQGNYQLVVFDSALDLIIATRGVSIAPQLVLGGLIGCNTDSGSCALGDVPVNQWFHRQEHRVFDDTNGNGIWDDTEEPSAIETGFNLRWRDGSLYAGNVSDGVGAFTFDQVFPFFSWLVAEVDFVRNQATGVTVVVDNGGPIPGSAYGPAPLDDNDFTFGGTIAPQDQLNPADGECVEGDGNAGEICDENDTYRVEHGPSLVEGFQGFIGQTSAFLWGKRHYADGENGGITGVVFYDVTRDVNDPELSNAPPWEPGIPGVTVNLYDSSGTTLLDTTFTDSWDNSNPTGCKWGDEGAPFVFSPDGGFNEYPRDCYDGLRVFNQARPAVFDGGYAFGPDFACDPDVEGPGGFTCPSWLNQSAADPSIGFLKPGDYVVEVVPPPGYEITRAEDKNVDFGDEYTVPTPALLPPKCVGDPYTLPEFLTLYPDDQVETFLAWTTGSYEPVELPLCDRKLVTMGVGTNSAADFFLFTEVPVAAHGIGFILDDTQAEFSPNAPNFGEKYAPPFMPVSIKDWTGREIGRTYSDQFGVYNFLVPSTSTTNVPAPSGMSPNMLSACMNDATLPDGSLDPQHNPIYSQFCYTLQYMPAVYTYLDTPVVPVGAFAGPDQFPVDCEFPDLTPRIKEVTVTTNGVGGGPYIPLVSGAAVAGNQTITIHSMGTVKVPNPEYCNNAAGTCPPLHSTEKLIERDYGFGGSAGMVTLGDWTLTCTWGEPITCTIPAGTPATVGGRQLLVTRAAGGRTKTGITVQVGLRALPPGQSGGTGTAKVVPVFPDTTGNLLATPLQDAIDNAGPNELLLVHPGTYNEMVVMWKPVQLQGFGEGSTKINALKQPAEKLTNWRLLVEDLINTGKVSLLPGQEAAFGGIEQVALMTEEGAGVLVLPKAGEFNLSNGGRNYRGARIDGFTITGADTGGGIVVNGYGNYVEISNNRVSNNSGTYAGGIRVGHPFLTNLDTGVPQYTDGQNDFVKIHHNTVNQNGSLDGAGAGISMCGGADSYRVTQNWVCGNFATSEGGGIGHIGLSDGTTTRFNPPGGGNNDQYWVVTDAPLIEDNTIIFNETFLQGRTVSGGGLYIGGAPPLAVGGLTPGAGNVVVNRNLIQGNGAGAGDGGGIRLAMVNGPDVVANPTLRLVGGNTLPRPWYAVNLFDNMIVNNVAGLAGGGISLQDAVRVRILHNTIANNDSLGTAGEAFQIGNPNRSNAQPGAGIVTRANSPQLAAAGAVGAFSDPRLENSIVWHNRKFFFFADLASGCSPADPSCLSTYGLCPDVSGNLNCPGVADPNPGTPQPVVYDDLGVIGAAGPLACDGATCITSTTGTAPSFVNPYVNGDRASIIPAAGTTPIQPLPTFDEGGNFINLRFGPLSLIDPDGLPSPLWNYHISAATTPQGINLGTTFPLLNLDFDLQNRPTPPDSGADELLP